MTALLSVSMTSNALSAHGWLWYDDNKITPVTPVRKVSTSTKNVTTLSATEQMASLRKAVREAKAKAILTPTDENVANYIELQNSVVNQATKFSQVWQRVLLESPNLDYNVLHPAESQGRKTFYAQHDIAIESAISKYRNKYGMFFFYRGNNPLDRALSNTVSNFTTSEKIALVPISIDGKKLPVFKDSQINRGQAEAIGVKAYPALILVNPKTKETIPINYGFASEEELRERFFQVSTEFKGSN